MPCDRTVPLQSLCDRPEVECGYVRNGCGDELFCGRWCPEQQQCGVREANRCGYPSLCTDEGWCWENPLPQGFGLNGSFLLDDHHAWFVGDNETILFFDGEKLSLQGPASPPHLRVNLLDVHASAPDDAVAGGRNGRLLHWDGQRWEVEGTDLPFTGNVRAVWSLGQGVALAAGGQGTVLLRRTSSAFLPSERWKVIRLPGGNNELRALHVTPDGVAWALAEPPALYASAPGNYESWEAVPVSPLPAGRRIAAMGEALYLMGNTNSGVAIGKLEFDGGYSVVQSVTGGINNAFAGDGGIWLIGGNGALSFLDATETLNATAVSMGPWQTGVWLPQGRPLLGGAFGAMGLVTAAGVLLSWSPQLALQSLAIGAVCGSSPDVMYAAGSREGFGCGQGTSTGGTQACVRFAARRESSRGIVWEWYRAGLGGTQNLLACYALDQRRFWLTGDDSKFVFWDPQRSPGEWGWGDFTGTFGGQYTGAWGLPDAGFFFARSTPELTTSPTGENGSFTTLDAGATAGLRSVWGTGGDHIVAVGASGAISRFDGTTWAYSENVATADLLAVHGAQLAAGGRRYVVGGTNGVLLSGDGELPWQTATEPAQRFNQAWVSSSGVAWAVGVGFDGGAWVERSEPGGPWSSVPLTMPRGLSGLFGFDHADGGHTIWVTGGQGLILRRP